MRFLIAGAGGHAQEVAWSLREQEHSAGRDPRVVFFDDRLPVGPLASGLGEIAGPIDALRTEARPDDALVLGVGLPSHKTSLVERLAALPNRWASVVHPRATVGPNVIVGEGSYVAAGAIVTVNVRLGRFTTVNMHCQVAHDGVVEEFATLHPDTHLAGHVTIGEGAELGAGSLVIPGLTIGPWAVLGAGCTVIRSLPGHATYVGIPAAPVAQRPRHRSMIAASRGPSSTRT